MFVKVRKNPITKEIEEFLFDFFLKNESEPFTLKEIENFCEEKFGLGLKPHVAWALDMLHANRIIKPI